MDNEQDPQNTDCTCHKNICDPINIGHHKLLKTSLDRIVEFGRWLKELPFLSLTFKSFDFRHFQVGVTNWNGKFVAMFLGVYCLGLHFPLANNCHYSGVECDLIEKVDGDTGHVAKA